MNYEAYSTKLKIITDPKRMKIIDLLSCGEMCACDILEHFDFTQPTLSHHMKTLENAGFVNVSKRGKWNYYSLNQETLADFMRDFNQLFFNSDNCICQEEHNKKTKEERLIS
ncbi:ArsR/SmtB family transcription factor [Vagococcus fluvialis]|uniref:ArsR/SmtB family transcription factor n=1 Tax=Vagococcus fluvialis TaxID=2738 RepID=UPI003D1107AD